MYWGIGVGVGVMGVLALVPTESFVELWFLHFDQAIRKAYEADTYGIRWRKFLDDWPVVVPALIGLWFGVRNRDSRALPPAILLTTAILTHSIHHPFWAPYYLHFTIPLAWLGGQGLDGAWRSWVKTCGGRSLMLHRIRMGLLSLAVAIPTAEVALERTPEINAFMKGHSCQPHLNDVRILRAHASSGAKWIYTPKLMLAFDAELLVPPEVAVIPEKRRKAGRISEDDIVGILAGYRPEFVLLSSGEEALPVWKTFLSAHHYRQAEVLSAGILFSRLGTP
jgi:hypothetical protein